MAQVRRDRLKFIPAPIKIQQKLKGRYKVGKVGGVKDELATPEKAERRDFWGRGKSPKAQEG